ncbi:MAG TPA: MerR family DNA-binding transcriptional regulator [Gemmatimonadales bacterium]|nr:MerR family DNA-binding transcriptional regulator [Gemmatimonadales bacterium]
MRAAPTPDGRLTIGTLSAATGIPPETIRTWERRYGFPKAERKPSGHRVYPLAAVPRLRRVAQAIARGHRPAQVVPASESALAALLAAFPMVPSPSAPGSPAAPIPDDSGATDVAALIDAARRFDSTGLRRGFQSGWARLGSLRFLEQRATPFLVAVGDAWAAGTMGVRHEHFASAALGDFLRAARVPVDERAGGPWVVLATLPGEQHGLGLEMAALVFALRGWRALVLGVDTPPAQIVALTREVEVRVVALSLIRRRPSRDVMPHLTALRRQLPRSVSLILGGSGVALGKLGKNGITVVPDLGALDRWAAVAPA